MLRKALLIVAAIAGALFALTRIFRRIEPLEWEEAPKPGKLIDIDGVAVDYIDEGSGPAVVLIHGFGGFTYSFRYLLPDLARDHRVVALDLMGFGYTQRPEHADYSLTAQARLVLALMDRLGIERAVVLGHSMGGEVAMRLAAMAPARVSGLILAASVSGDRLVRYPPIPLFKAFFPMLSRLFGRRIFRRLFFDPTLATAELRAAYEEPTRVRGSLDGVWEVVKGMRRDSPIDYDAIRAPVLILWGEAERIVPRWTLARLKKRFPNARVVTIERAGHMLLEEQPQECLSAMRPFLAETQAPEKAGASVAKADAAG